MRDDDRTLSPWEQAVERGRRLAWYDGPQAVAEVAPDAHNKAIGAPRLFADE